MNQKILGLGLLMCLLAQPAMAQVRLNDLGLPPPKKAPPASSQADTAQKQKGGGTKTASKADPTNAQGKSEQAQVVAPAPTTYGVPDNLKGLYTPKDRYRGYPFYGGNNFLQSDTVRFTSDYDIGATVKGVSGQPMKMQGGDYVYKDGYFFKKIDDKGNYQVVQPPLNATIPKLPPNATPTGSGYYFNGAYYVRSGQGYKAVKPPQGTLVPYLSNAAKPVGGEVYKDGNTYYQPFYVQGNMGYIIQFEVMH